MTKTFTPREKDERFIAHLWGLDRKAFAELRRSLKAPPRQALAAIPYVERFAMSERFWSADMIYLVAGLFCLVERPLEPGQDAPKPPKHNFGESMGQLYVQNDKSASTEHRFIRLLDADETQLPDRLRQCVTLLRAKDIPIGWEQLLTDLRSWQGEQRRVQHAWARRFYMRQA